MEQADEPLAAHDARRCAALGQTWALQAGSDEAAREFDRLKAFDAEGEAGVEGELPRCATLYCIHARVNCVGPQHVSA